MKPTKGSALVGGRQRQQGRGPNERRAIGEQVLAMRNRGVKMYEVAKELGIGEATADRYMKLALEARIAPTVDEFRRQQNDRLDESSRKAAEQVELAERMIMEEAEKQARGEQPSTSVILSAATIRAQALALAVKIDERRARLNGLDAPVQVQATVQQVDKEDAELADFIREAQARAAAEKAEAAQ